MRPKAAFLCLVLATLSAWPCSVPVFRYALERWPASPYQVIVFHRDPLSTPHQTVVARLSAGASTNAPLANVTVQTVDLATNPPPEMLSLWQLQPSDPLPALVLRYPPGAAGQGEVWRGPLTEESASQVLDSPVRRRVVQRLLQGDSAVWVLLESGDASQDAAASRTLQTRLDHLQKTLKLSKLDAEDIANRVISIAEEEIRVAFSFLRLPRTDPAERILIRMLLGSEDDLGELKEPMAFPIIGRGRALFALVGQGITPENIDEACSFLTGPCSCVVKEENPGVDLLLSADWDHLVRVTATPDRELPELTGFTAFLKESNATGSAAGATPPAGAGPPVALAGTPPSFPPESSVASGRSTLLKSSVLIALGLGALALVAGTIRLLRRKG